MDRPLAEHISYLERRLRELNQQLMDDQWTLAERSRIESEIRAAELALVYYRQGTRIGRTGQLRRALGRRA